MSTTKTSSLQANLFFQSDNKKSFTEDQIRLLLAIQKTGSITGAARLTGISYKTAWDRIETMNNLSDSALVSRSAGGNRGGGSKLTQFGERILVGFQALQDAHKAFMSRPGNNVQSIDDIANFIRSNKVASSARNQFSGRIVKVKEGAINTEIELRISKSVVLTAIITNESQMLLDLKKDDHAIALIKSSWVILSADTTLKTSARNKLTGRIIRLQAGEVNCEVILDLGEGKSICAMITNNSVRDLALKEGDTACALFKASSVILMLE